VNLLFGIQAGKVQKDHKHNPACNDREVADGGDPVEPGELPAQGMILGGGDKGRDLLLYGGCPRFDGKCLEGGKGEHENQYEEDRYGVLSPRNENRYQRHCAAGEPPFEIAGEEGADYLAGGVAVIDPEDDRGKDKGE